MLSLLLAQIVPASDTLVLVPSRDVVDLVIALAAASVAATFVAILATIVIFLAQARKAIRTMEEARRKFTADPAIQSLRRASENVEAISRSVREEATRLSESVGRLSGRVEQASDRLEERIEEFNALLEVMQGEAEQTFVDGAARARGFRAGLGHLTGDGRPARAVGAGPGPGTPPEAPLSGGRPSGSAGGTDPSAV